jgi:hypothetical protein
MKRGAAQGMATADPPRSQEGTIEGTVPTDRPFGILAAYRMKPAAKARLGKPVKQGGEEKAVESKSEPEHHLVPISNNEPGAPHNHS